MTVFILFNLGFLFSCNQQNDIYSLQDYSLFNCHGKTKSFVLPEGWVKTQTYHNGHGYIELIEYPDQSYIMILCAFTTEISTNSNIGNDLFSRTETINGSTIIYDDVTIHRKSEFDHAFNLMLH